MRKINWREWQADLWNQKMLTLPGIILSLALLLLVARLGISLFEYARLARAALAFPFPLDYSEGPILDQTLRLAQFENIYRNSIASPPYTVSNYPPLFQLIQVPFAWIVGPAFWYGRLISILSALSAAGLIGLILNTLTGDRIAATMGGLTLLAFPYLLQGSVLNQVDALALALSLGGLSATVGSRVAIYSNSLHKPALCADRAAHSICMAMAPGAPQTGLPPGRYRGW